MLYRKYGISQEDYEAMFARQMGVCAICGRPETHIQKNGRVNALHIDHCHSSGVVRELLCNHCNTMLGSANDSIEVLQRAIAYLKKHST